MDQGAAHGGVVNLTPLAPHRGGVPEDLLEGGRDEADGAPRVVLPIPLWKARDVLLEAINRDNFYEQSAARRGGDACKCRVAAAADDDGGGQVFYLRLEVTFTRS